MALSNKSVLITGGTGSLGKALVKTILETYPDIKRLVIYSRDEQKQFQMAQEFPESKYKSIRYFIGDVRDYERLKRAFFGIDFVIHAAAMKHVHIAEYNPDECVKTNIGGAENVIKASLDSQVSKVVALSTDKACAPINLYGATKLTSDKLFVSANRIKGAKDIKFSVVRYGNVMGSNGSVIPLFKKQIEQGGPITVTDDRITRYFMTIPEACQLVLEAANMGKGGEIFVFDMGESVKIIDLAKKMIQLSGLELGKDIEIKVIGLRPGEKLYEELLAAEENTEPTHHPQILIARIREAEEFAVLKIGELVDLFDLQDNYALVSKMKEIVPEFLSNNSEFSKLDK